MNSLRYASRGTHIACDMHVDLAWWLAFMDHFNGSDQWPRELKKKSDQELTGQYP